MRSCIYCGRELEKGEKCNCAQSVRMRAAKQQGTSGANKSEEEYKKYKEQQTGEKKETYDSKASYQTGYTKKQTKRERGSFRKSAKMNRTKAKESAREIKNSIAGMIRNMLIRPMDMAADPGYIPKSAIIVVNALMGIALSFCEYSFVASRQGRGIASFLAGYGYPTGAAMMPAFILANAVVITAMVFLFELLVYAADKFVLRNHTGFWIFSMRITAAMMPILASAAVGAIISIFTVYGMIMLLAAGCSLSCILLYEALRNQWVSLPRSAVFYITGIDIFIFTMICFNIFRILL